MNAIGDRCVSVGHGNGIQNLEGMSRGDVTRACSVHVIRFLRRVHYVLKIQNLL